MSKTVIHVWCERAVAICLLMSLYFIIVGVAFGIALKNLLFAILIVLPGMIMMIGCIIALAEFDCYKKTEKLIDGENKKLRREMKKLYKLKAEKQRLEGVKARQEKMEIEKEEILTLKCQIHNLQLELKGKQGICEYCGAKIYKRACYCPQCGHNLKEVLN